MNIKKRRNILWGEFTGSSFLHGSTVHYHSPEHVSFENRLMPSGYTIHEWSSSFNYQANRLTPSLPLLKKGRRYRLTGDMQVYPQGSVFLKVIFYNRYNEEVSHLIERSACLDFVYPQDAYHYRVYLLSAGVEHFDFYSLSITEKETDFHD